MSGWDVDISGGNKSFFLRDMNTQVTDLERRKIVLFVFVVAMKIWDGV